MKNNFKKIIFSILIFVIIILLIVLVIKNINNNASIVIFTSDYQDDLNTNIKTRDKNLNLILNKIKENNINPDLVAYLGDYQKYWPIVDGESFKGIDEIKKITNSIFENIETIFISGNHDVNDYDINSSYFSKSGLHEYDNYYLYLINFQEYTDILTLRNNLTISLLNVNKSKPIIILGHMPLHYTVRNDNYGYYPIFELLNYYGTKLDIIYMFGHNHSMGNDIDIGGSVVYKTVNDSIKLKYPNNNIVNIKLNFTYMNAGYIGYYNDDTTGLDVNVNTNYDTEETMSVFKIKNDKINITRYNKSGIYKEYIINLKNNK